MPLNPNIILQGQGVQLNSPLDVASKAQTLKSMSRKNKAADEQDKKNKALEGIYKKNTITTEDGQTDLDRKGLLNDMYKADPRAAMKQEKAFADQDLAEQTRMLQDSTQKLAKGKQLVWGIRDQQSWTAAKQEAQRLGLPFAQEMSDQYDPEALESVMKPRFLTAEQQIAEKWNDKKFQQAKKESEMDRKSRERVAAQKAKGTAAKPTEFQKAKEKKEAANYVERQEGLKTLDSGIETIDRAFGQLKKYSKESSFGGTGPFASGFGVKKYFDKDSQDLNALFKQVNLKNMVQTFSGMSKAIDSDAERNAWNGTQPDITNDDDVNAKIILGQKSILLKDKAETQSQQQYVEQNGSMNGYKSPVYGKVTTLVSPAGELTLVTKEQIEQAEAQGFMTIDEYGEIALDDSAGTNSVLNEANAGESQVFKTNQIDWAD